MIIILINFTINCCTKISKINHYSTSGGDSLIVVVTLMNQLTNFKIVGKQGAKIKLRVKVKYNINNSNSVEEQFDFAGFKIVYK